MKKRHPLKRPVRGTRVLDGTFTCTACGQTFEDKPSKDAHERLCETLGYSATPRPHDLKTKV